MITGIKTAGAERAAVARGRTAVARGRFAVPESLGGAPSVGPTAAAASLDGMLALQEDHRDPDLSPDQRAREGGAAILAELGAMHRACLGHGDAVAVAARLSGLVDGLPDATDPGLAGVLRLIALRARIEVLRAGGQ
jgi:hypothetical protein